MYLEAVRGQFKNIGSAIVRLKSIKVFLCKMGKLVRDNKISKNKKAHYLLVPRKVKRVRQNLGTCLETSLLNRVKS